MENVPFHKRAGSRLAGVILIIVLLIGVLVVGFQYSTQLWIDSVSVDESSEWEKYFLSTHGFATICVRSHVLSQRHADYISIVGANRPIEWFEKMGFQDVTEVEMVVRTSACILPGEEFYQGILPQKETRQRVLAMQHPMAPMEFFVYLPRSGVLIHD